MRQRISHVNGDFYKLLGPLFGSREVQRVTTDRFYDDPEKEWIICIDEKGNITLAISILKGMIKNMYSVDPEEAVAALIEMKDEVVSGIIPAIYQSLFIRAGYKVEEHSKNYIKITGGFHGK